MKINYNVYLENKNNIEKFLMIENYIINENLKKNILQYYENDYKIKDNFNTFYFIENENNNKKDYELFYNKCLKLIKDIEKKFNIECFIYLFDIDNNYNYYEMKLFINFYKTNTNNLFNYLNLKRYDYNYIKNIYENKKILDL